MDRAGRGRGPTSMKTPPTSPGRRRRCVAAAEVCGGRACHLKSSILSKSKQEVHNKSKERASVLILSLGMYRSACGILAGVGFECCINRFFGSPTRCPEAPSAKRQASDSKLFQLSIRSCSSVSSAYHYSHSLLLLLLLLLLSVLNI